jgi:hypothetical protein
MQNLNKYILDNAPSNICEPGIAGVLGAQSVDDLLKMYVRDIDFCLETEFPSPSDLVQYGGEWLAQYGIYVNHTAPLQVVERGFVVLLDKCRVKLTAEPFSASEVYIKHHSTVTLHAHPNAAVFLDVFDNAELHVQADTLSKVTVYAYGKAKVTYSGLGQVKVVNKHKSTY